MAKIDKEKEQINLNKFALGLIAIIIFSTTGFVASNYLTLNPIVIVMLSMTLIVLTYVFTIIFSKTIEKINNLEDL